ncbi:hypothetical protein GF340_01415 [Candidatus Peregrinibacteria bacterium]|nr:hypothetical protein [Candidatus Peregrinibacteria bacterium]
MKRITITLEPHMEEDFVPLLEYIKEKGCEPHLNMLEWEHKTEDNVISGLRSSHGVVAGGEPYTKRVLQELQGSLEIIARFGIGYDHIDINAATEVGIAITNTPGKMSSPVAEMNLGLLLNISRGVGQFDRKIRNGEWWTMMRGTELEGKTVGLIGFGNIAQKFTQYLIGFNCTVLAYDINFDETAAKKLNVKRAELDKIASESDFVSMHIPDTEKTRGMIDKSFFNKMKNTAFFINTARGSVVVERDLIDALQRGAIKGAGLDVFEKEPIQRDNPLLSMDNVILTPHIAAITHETMISAGFQAVDNIIDCFQGRKPRNILNPDFSGNK